VHVTQTWGPPGSESHSSGSWKSPRRSLVSTQVATTILEGMDSGLWIDQLPGERELAQSFRVGRNTVRRALKQLEAQGVVKAKQGIGYRLLRSRRAGYRATSRSVGLILPVPFALVRPSSAIWADHLRAALFDWGLGLDIHSGPSFFGNRAEKSLPVLVSRHRHQCWIVLASSLPTQKWFAESGVPCLLAGSSHRGIDLPSVDLDRRGLCRHAAGLLLARGHEHIAFFHSTTGMAGDIEGAEGFLEAVGSSSHKGARAQIVTHEPDAAGIESKVRRLFTSNDSPTGVLVSNPLHFLTVFSTLLQMGKRVPADVSLISQDYESVLDFLTPEPTCYELAPQVFARSLITLLEGMLNQTLSGRRQVRLIPDLRAGATLGHPPVNR